MSKASAAVFAECDRYLQRMREVGKKPGCIWVSRDGYNKVIKSLRNAARKEGAKEEEVGQIRWREYRGYEVRVSS